MFVAVVVFLSFLSFGEKGRSIMASCIRTWFPYAGIQNLTIFSPLSLDYFIEHVAVPQCAALLIAGDQDVSSEDANKLV